MIERSSVEKVEPADRTMEPFIQRMLERAAARREKLDEQLSSVGHDVKKRRSPLKDANALLEQAAAASSPVKSPVKPTSNVTVKSPVKSFVSKSVKSDTNEQTTQDNKENGEVAISNVKSKLQRLGKLYSDDTNIGLSSPIHRTEEKFNAEESIIDHKPTKRGARLDRLAALASTINNWEDDLSHPTLPSGKNKTPDKAERIQAKFNEQVKSASEPQPSTSKNVMWVAHTNDKKIKDPSPIKHLKWDKNVLESLEAQGFSRTQSNTRLVYDYKNFSQELKKGVTRSSSPIKRASSVHRQVEEKKLVSPGKSDSSKTKRTDDDSSLTGSSANSSKSNDSKVSHTPEKLAKNANTTSSSRLPTRLGFNGSPKTLVQPSGSVLSKASMFEAKNADSQAKDPAQMTLAERMALFERNKGVGPLIPKAPLTMSIPPKKLQEKSNVPSGSNADSSPNNRNSKTPGKTVLEQCAVFEQGNNRNKVEEMENQILQATYAERQRELNMLRSRFNANKETGNSRSVCVRTSESSEGGKPSSPKNSLICPVKPTPAPDNVTGAAPPPPPPLPSPQSKSVPCSKSPVKRQVVGSSPKVQHLNAVPDVKRIRVCPPKPGSLYPNLSEIEATTTEESETESQYTSENSTEAVTATLDERTDSETDTATEAEFYVRNDTDRESESEGTINSSFGRTSLCRTVLHAFNERALFNKKRSIEPDPDSTSEFSALNDMDQYLDECLEELRNEEDVKEEGPTPPKVNKSGASPRCNSIIKYVRSIHFKLLLKVFIFFNYISANNQLLIYRYRSPLKTVSSIPSPKKPDVCIEQDGQRVPLTRTVSAYRREQFELAKMRSTAKAVESDPTSGSAENRENESRLVEEKVKNLLEQVQQQQNKIEGASKALNLCLSTVEFNGSSEHVGGEWALLVATHKRQAALNEIQRLKREGTLRPAKPGSPEVQGSGSLTISAITLPLKQEYFRNMDMNTYLHCVCLMYHLGEVVATQAATAEPGDSCLRFTSMLKLENLYSDFKIDVEVYSFQTQPKFLPHEKKYHISLNAKAAKKDKTPKKKNQFVMPDIQSPAGPTAIRSPAFKPSGCCTLTLKDVNREQFALLGISSNSPLEGYLRMRISRKLSVSVEHHGFLTFFKDVTNLPAWCRRWCWLKDAKLYYWEYPEDEHKKNPIGHLNLEGMFTKNVQFVNREKCARPFTFLLETMRPAQPEDADSLIMKTNGIETTIEHLISADTKELGLQWMSKLNKTLSLIRAWGPFRNPA
ncbi:anillin isoform X2 [Pseudomyrmex gracilis]|uniref:anillin isoform X2 n=1 Tax=Pseudomyrmex gracilis TaxID=219809 RepID=UPI00099566D6|nr:anillin isoform X2 [Pseudomyrmex gracilis]